MTVPKKFRLKEPGTRTIKYKHYEYVKSYPNFIQYRCKENKSLECFQRIFFITNQIKEITNDNYNNNYKGPRLPGN